MSLRDTTLEDTKKLFSHLLLTCKNVSLYPEGHVISSNSIRQFSDSLQAFIRQYGTVKIEIERDRVLCQGMEVHKGPSEEGTLPFTLFRDGIRWLEFREGIQQEEIRDVLSIIQRYSVLAAEPEGDIVTAFWEAHFDHVQYEADDFVADQTSDQEERLEEPEKQPPEEEAEVEDNPEPSVGPSIDATPLGGIALDPSYFLLTPAEQVELQEMVSREEKLSTNEHLNMLLDIILQFQEEKDFNIVLGVLSEEFEGAYDRRDFEAALIILDGLQKILVSGRLQTPWAGPLIESFYNNISSVPKCLKPLEDIWSKLNVQQMDTIKLIFQHLKPNAAYTLFHFLLIGQPSRLEQIVEDTVVSLARKDINCLASLINVQDERIAEKLVPALSRLEGDTSLKYLMKLARHTSVSVRRMAIKAIAQTHGNQTLAMFEFIDDPDPQVRRVILTQMGQSRNEAAEKILMQYLQDKKVLSSSSEHIIECFKTLGKCGSSRSVPFLTEKFLHRKWMAVFTKSVFREGAAFALAALNIPEARQVIDAAGRGLNPGLRKLAREAEKEFPDKNKGGR
jgi:hypothetical protein